MRLDGRVRLSIVTANGNGQTIIKRGGIERMADKKKMSNRRFKAIWIPIISILVILTLALNIAAGIFGGILDTSLGRGERHVVKAEGTENWNTAYYEQKYATLEEAKAAAEEKMREVVNEGMVLLKNNGVLPLAAGSTVTPFGKGYVHPVYNGMTEGGSIKYTPSEAGVSPSQALARNFTIVSAAADLQPADMGLVTDGGFGGYVQIPEEGGWAQVFKYENYPDAPVAAEGTSRHNIMTFGADSQIPELSVSAYDVLDQAVLDQMKSTAALVFVSRSGNEDRDKKSDGYSDGTPHYLALSRNERDMIAWAKAHCESVILIVNSSNPIELMPVMQGELEVDAILWAGHPGDCGFESMSDILCGTVNPSGRLVDLYATDFLKTPSFKNWGNFHYTNSEEGPGSEPYVEYEEGMYNGYRYYETAYDLQADGFVYGTLDEAGACVEMGEVAYPFGYGLSYTSFSQKIRSFDVDDSITLEVAVTNEGDKAGKEVVQLYFSAPYTALDQEMKIEKPTAVLAAFGKTDLLQPGETGIVTLSFGKDELASYCYTRDNGDGTTGCYMLEEGDYTFSIRKNSHDVIESRIWSNPNTIWYDNSNPRPAEIAMQAAMDEEGNLLNYPEKIQADPDARFIAATNLFPYMSDYMNEECTLLTRADWIATLPFGEKKTGKTISQKYPDMFGKENSFDYQTDPELGNVEGSYVYVAEPYSEKQKNDLSLINLRGKDYYDPAWDLLLDQLDYEADHDAIKQILTATSYSTNAVSSIGMMESIHCEGANGIRLDNGDGAGTANSLKTASWCMAPEMASTWNVELLKELGEAMGQEALLGGKQGRMSPAFNLHRSPFQGRVFEYYSEDPLLSGKVAAAVVSGTSSSGMFDFIKHFGLNDQETNRSKFLHTWATEQVVREMYNRPFEICIREARKTVRYIADADGAVASRVMRGCTAMMGAQNCFGPTIAFGNYDLITRLVRNEWNFNGYINTDMFNGSNEFVEFVIRAGTDSWLVWNSLGELNDYDSPTAKSVIRNALHHVAYAIANSSATQHVAPGSIVYYDMSPWRIALIGVTVAVLLLTAVMIIWTVVRSRDSKANPEKYRQNEKI